MLDRVSLVLGHLKEFNLKIKLKKTYFFQKSVVFLGHVLSKDGISLNQEKVSKVRDWPVPKLAKEVLFFLGLASYYCQFIPQFVNWANALHNLIHPVVQQRRSVLGLGYLLCLLIYLLFTGHLIIRSPLKS